MMETRRMKKQRELSTKNPVNQKCNKTENGSAPQRSNAKVL